MRDIGRLEHSLVNAERDIAALRRRREADIERARQNRTRDEVVTDMEQRAQRFQEREEAYLGKLRAELETARDEAAADEQQRVAESMERGRSEDAPRREQARRRWIAAGYDPAGFEQAYDDARKLDILAAGPANTRRVTPL